MDAHDSTLVSELFDRIVLSADGAKIGIIEDVYFDDHTEQPDWVAVRTGWFGTKVSFVPIAGMHFVGDNVMVPYTKEQVRDAPTVESGGHLSAADEVQLYSYYESLAGGTIAERAPAAPALADPPLTPAAGAPVVAAEDDAIVRSEEELHVDKQVREVGRARLRKWIETEHVQVTVPVRREKARVEVEPAAGAPSDAPDPLAAGEHDIVLSEEVVDLSTRMVPQHRVRLETETISEDVPVAETIRKERVGYEDDGAADR